MLLLLLLVSRITLAHTMFVSPQHLLLDLQQSISHSMDSKKILRPLDPLRQINEREGDINRRVVRELGAHLGVQVPDDVTAARHPVALAVGPNRPDEDRHSARWWRARIRPQQPERIVVERGQLDLGREMHLNEKKRFRVDCAIERRGDAGALECRCVLWFVEVHVCPEDGS